MLCQLISLPNLLVKLQGIFGEPVLAELVFLQVKLADDQDRFVSVPLVFAVTCYGTEL